MGSPSERPDERLHEFVARRFHEEYETLAPSYGYETRRESAVPWEDVPETNRALMVATVAGLFRQGVISASGSVNERAELRGALEELRSISERAGWRRLQTIAEEALKWDGKRRFVLATELSAAEAERDRLRDGLLAAMLLIDPRDGEYQPEDRLAFLAIWRAVLKRADIALGHMDATPLDDDRLRALDLAEAHGAVREALGRLFSPTPGDGKDER